jgi:hypothetical protein
MSDALHAKLKAIEPRIAEAYKAAVKDNVIDAAALRAIMMRIADPKGPKEGDISPEEAEALVLIIDSGELNPASKTALLDVLRTKTLASRILNGTGVELKSDDPELASFHSVFAIRHTGNLKFHSKGTNLTYSPSQYQAIAQLVKDGKIKVVKVMDRGLSAKTGQDALYVAGINTFFFNQHAGETDFFSRPAAVVHEATHAVQDWFDVTATVRHIETDAYIAEAVVDKSTRVRDVLKTAAKFVIDGKATKGNKAWEQAYDAAAELIDTHPVYKDRAKDVDSMAEKANEATELAKVIKALERPAGKSPAPRK